MHRQHLLRARGKLQLGHGQQRTARAVHHKIGQGVVQRRRAVAAQLHTPALRLRMEAIAQQGQQHMGARKLGQQVGMHLPMARQRGGQNHGVQRRCLQLEADGAVDGLGIQIVIGIDGLRRARPALHLLLHHGG